MRKSLPHLYHYTVIHHSLLLSSAESLLSPSAICFTDVMTSLALDSTSHRAVKPEVRDADGECFLNECTPSDGMAKRQVLI